MTSSSDCIYWVPVCGSYPFWNKTAVLPTAHRPGITVCFENTVLTWLSCGILWIVFPFYTYYLNRRSGLEVQRCMLAKRSFFNIAKLIIGAFQIIIPIVEIIIVGSMALKDENRYVQFMLASAIRFVTMALAWSFTAVEFSRAVYTSAVLTVYWFVYALINAASMYAFAYKKSTEGLVNFEIYYFGLLASGYCLAVVQFLLQCLFVDAKVIACIRNTKRGVSITESRVNLIDSDDRLGTSSSDTLGFEENMNEKPINPQPSFFSSLFFLWVVPLLYRGMKRNHTSENLPDVPDASLCSSLYPEFERQYNEDVDKSYRANLKKSKVYSRRLLWTMLPSVVFWGFMRLLTVILLIVNLFIFRKLIQYVKNPEQVIHPWLGYLFSVALLLVALVRALCVAHWLDGCDKIGLKLKILISTTVYRKMLKLSSSCASQGMDIGYISNLMSVDSLKLFQSVRSLHEIGTIPIYLVLSLVFLYECTGISGVIGIVCLIAVVPTTTFGLAHLNRKLQEKQMLAKDKRLKYLSEIIAGMKVLKLYAWEDPFEDKVSTARKAEMKSIWFASILNAIGNIVCLVSPFVVSLIVFVYHIYVTEKELEASEAFVCLSLICMLNCSISVMPCSLAFLIQGIISIKKAASLMDMDEVEGDLNRVFVDSLLTGPAVSIQNTTFSWDGKKESLKDINLTVKPGSLVAIVGLVGSGKSSVLAAMLGEMRTMKGEVKIMEKTVYVSQQAWIQNCTVRENICLNRQFIENKYNKVIEACHLSRDLQKFPGGDLTEIGGKGANLSGGQRQRVNLARAVYTKADLYLIDDALSAVDPKVAQHIFKQVISKEGLLKKKTRIFATNSIGFLHEMDQIVVMNNGAIECTGTYDEIIKMKGEYFDFLRQHACNPSMTISVTAEKVLRRGMSIGPGSIVPSGFEEHRYNMIRKQLSNKELTFWNNIRTTFREMSFADDIDLSGDYVPDETFSPSRLTPTTSIIQRETVDSGQIRWGAVGNYIRSGGYLIFVIVLLGHLAMLMTQSASYVWLQIWMDDEKNQTSGYYVANYGIIGAVEICSIIIINFAMAFGFSSASKILHNKAINRLFRAPMSYFDTTSPGQIFNYLSTDMDTVDCALPLDVQLWLISFCVVISSVGTIAWANPVYLAITLPIIFVSAIVQRIYGKSAIQLRREYAMKKTPVYSHFEESISGVVSIRSYKKQLLFISKSDRLTDDSHKPWHSYLLCWRWYTLFNELMGVLAIFLTAITAVQIQHQDAIVGKQITAGKIGLALFSIFQVLPHIPIATRMMIEVEAHIVAVERMIKLASINQEASREAQPGFRPRSTWPEAGQIEFKGLCVKYRPDLDNVLNNLSFVIDPENKVGVVGETGAGKSSIIMTLFRMMEASLGSILIDGTDIKDIGLHDLRTKLTCIPQEPILFSGTLRSNLDALSRYSDTEIWKALEQAQLREFLSLNMPLGLDHVINSEDEVCVGQRQLLCLARALLRNSKVIILDEPTAAVDYQTDQTIQQIIRREFSRSTVITVAHRLATIKDYSRILVLDRGQVLEYDSPEKLLADPHSKFYEMDRSDRKEEEY